MSNFDYEVAASGRTGVSNNARYSENISFRIPKVVLDQLRQEAKENQITLNTLLNQIIDS
jgi:predicted HicB family RNase H-like nuclease